MKKSRYSIGDVIVLRDIWFGKIWTARPAIVVQDNIDLIALHIPLGTKSKQHHGLTSDLVSASDRKNKSWVLRDRIWDGFGSYIKLAIPNEPYSVLLFLNDNDDSLLYWYVNLEDPENPMHRTAIGFDCTDHILDMIIQPNLKKWCWVDEDELLEATQFGLISQEKARFLYSKGEEVKDMIVSGESIFNPWERWRPNPSWGIPVLPDGWDVVI